MKLDIISYQDLLAPNSNSIALEQLKTALLCKGIVGIRNVPEFENKTRAYIDAARKFAALDDAIKQQYAPNRAIGDTEGYELSAEQFKDERGKWQTDDKKASFYAVVPNDPRNKWPTEINLKTPYLTLGELIFNTGKLVLKTIGLDETVGIDHDLITGYGRMLHYHKENDVTNANPNWCGEHFDHGIFTGLVPAYYFRNGIEIDEPEEAGLYIIPNNGSHFEKINANDKSVLLFQVGEFGQLASHDRIHATKHVVKKATGGIERFTLAVFYNADNDTSIKSNSKLISDTRYTDNQLPDGSINYKKWSEASFERYLAK